MRTLGCTEEIQVGRRVTRPVRTSREGPGSNQGLNCWGSLGSTYSLKQVEEKKEVRDRKEWVGKTASVVLEAKEGVMAQADKSI